MSLQIDKMERPERAGQIRSEQISREDRWAHNQCKKPSHAISAASKVESKKATLVSDKVLGIYSLDFCAKILNDRIRTRDQGLKDGH